MTPRVILTVGATVHCGVEQWLTTLDLTQHIVIGKDLIRKSLFGSLQAFKRALEVNSELSRIVDQMNYVALEQALLIEYPNIVVYGTHLTLDSITKESTLFKIFGVVPEIRVFECSRPVLIDRNVKGDPDNFVDEQQLNVMHREFMHKDAWWKKSDLPWTRINATRV